MNAHWTQPVVNTLVRLLPHGGTRDRYRREFLSELHGLPATDQIRMLLGISVSLHSLRRALNDPHSATYVPPAFHRALRCRLHLGHHWANAYTEDGQRFRQCLRCGEDSGSTGAGSGDWAAGINIAIGGH